jgi:hypothetical protein
VSARILSLKRGLEPLGQRLIGRMVAQKPPSHSKHRFEAIATREGVAIPASQPDCKDIELARISQVVTKRFYNLLAVGEGGRCPKWVLAA